MHHRAFGNYPLNVNCPPEHTWGGDEDMTCAMAEGFASYFAVATRGDATGETAALEHNIHYTGGDGSRIEGAVASFLYDLTDPANEAHDQVALPGSYLASVMATCNVHSGAWRHADRVSQFIYCLENAVDPAARAMFTTDVFVDGYTETAAEPAGWSPAAIRVLWRKNLFGQ